MDTIFLQEKTPIFPEYLAERILLVSAADTIAPSGGRAMLSQINLVILQELFRDKLTHFKPMKTSSKRRDAWRGYVDGVDEALIANISSIIIAEKITQLFVDGSNFGAAVAVIKRNFPRLRIITFFHNVEARFFWGSFRARCSFKALAVLIANYIAERKAVRASDVLLALSERDSNGLRHLYGRGADVITPMILDDKPAQLVPRANPLANSKRYVLFVGGNFYANIAGIDWFVRDVAPRTGLHVIVVGRGMETLAKRFAGNDTVTLVNDAADLAPWYAGAMLVVAPIFDGSGMKTKVAEALMFGKHIVGTPEAFSGYAPDVIAANHSCATADAFVETLALAAASPPPAFDPMMRALYDRDHSPAAARERLIRIFTAPHQGLAELGSVPE
jgi:glycosyltransferase involved in cell wall biosynthesis